MTCPNCGRATEPGSRFCAGCGTDLAAVQAPPVAPPPPPSYPPQQPYAQSAYPPQQPYAQSAYPPQQPYAQPAYPPQQPYQAPVPPPPPAPAAEPEGQAPAKRRRRRWLLPVAGAGALVLAGGIAGAAVLLSSDGSSSPEEAVTRLADAVSAEDVVGAVNALEPSEFGQLADLYGQASDRAEKIGVAPGADASRLLSGLDLRVDGLKTDVRVLADGVAKVEITGGSFSWKLDTGSLDPGIAAMLQRSGTKVDDAQGSIDLTDLTARPDGSSIAPFLMAVDQGDGWYVSPTYTLAEYAVEAAGLPKGDYSRVSQPVRGVGGSTPEEAVQSIAETLRTKGAVPAIEQLSDQAGGVLAVYQDAIVELLRQNLDGFDSWTADVRVSTRATQLDDGRAAVSIASVAGQYYAGSDSGSVEFNGDCPTGNPDACFGPVGDLLSVQDVHVIVGQRDGEWVIDPFGTVWDYAQRAVDGLDESAWLQFLAESDLQELAPPAGTVTAGQPAEFTLNSAGFLVLTADLNEGTAYSGWWGDGGLTFGGGDSQYVGGGFELYTPQQSGPATIVLRGDPGQTGQVSLYEMATAQPGTLGTPVEGALQSGQCAGYPMATGGAQDVVAALNASGGNVVVDSVGGDAYSYAGDGNGNIVFSTGGGDQVTFQVCNGGEGEASYQLTVSPYSEPGYEGAGYGAASGSSSSQPTIDGYAGSAEGYASVDGTATHAVYVPAGEVVTVAVSPVEGLDVVVDVLQDGADAVQFNSAGDGGQESFTVSGGSGGTYLEVDVSVAGASTLTEGSYAVDVY